MDTNTVTTAFVEKSKEILQDNLAGIYLHETAVMGCFNPVKGIYVGTDKGKNEWIIKHLTLNE